MRSKRPQEMLKEIVGPRLARLIKNPLFTSALVIVAGAERVGRQQFNKRKEQVQGFIATSGRLASLFQPSTEEIPDYDHEPEEPEEPVVKPKRTKKRGVRQAEGKRSK